MLIGLSAGASPDRGRIRRLPMLCRGAAMRFLLTRLYDWLNTPAGRLRQAQGSAGVRKASCASIAQVSGPGDLWPGPGCIDERAGPRRATPAQLQAFAWSRSVHRRRLFRQSRPRRLGLLMRWKGNEKEFCGGEPTTTNNRMELQAVIKRPERPDAPRDDRRLYRQPVCSKGHQRMAARPGSSAAGKPPTTSQ